MASSMRQACPRNFRFLPRRWDYHLRQLRHSQLSLPSRNCWQVVLIIQLVVQIKLAPFIEVKLDVVSAAAAAMLRKFLF